MKKTTILKASSLLSATLCLLLLGSCDKQESNYEPKASANTELAVGTLSIKVKDGRLVFEDKKQFEETLKAFQGLSVEEREKVAETSKFTSYREGLALIDEKATSKDELSSELIKSKKIPDISSEVLSTFLNDSGVIQIGEDVFKVGVSGVYEVKEAQLSSINDLSKISVNSSDVKLHAIEKSSKAARLQSTDKYLDFDPYHRAVGSFWKNNYWFYSEVGISLQSQTYNEHSFLWWSWGSWDNSDDTENVTLSLEYARVYYNIGGYEYWVYHNNRISSEKSSAYFPLGWVVFGVVDVPELHAVYSAKYNRTINSTRFDW